MSPAAGTGIDPSGEMINTTAVAVQTCYQSGVPHTDAAGSLRTAYGPDSFFPNGVFWVSDHPTDAGAISALSAAGFNTALTTRNADVSSLLAQITDDSFKLIINEDLLPGDHFISQPSTFDEALFQRYKNDPRVLAWWLDDEPLHMAVKKLDDPGAELRRHRSGVSRAQEPDEPAVLHHRGDAARMSGPGGSVSSTWATSPAPTSTRRP